VRRLILGKWLRGWEHQELPQAAQLNRSRSPLGGTRGCGRFYGQSTIGFSCFWPGRQPRLRPEGLKPEGLHTIQAERG